MLVDRFIVPLVFRHGLSLFDDSKPGGAVADRAKGQQQPEGLRRIGDLALLRRDHPLISDRRDKPSPMDVVELAFP